MAENKNHILQPRKLNLNVPPLSTRRPAVNTAAPSSQSNVATNMVPFSWERIPGEPKDKQMNSPPPTPRPPPGWRAQPPPEEGRFSDGIDIFSLAESGDDDDNWKATSGRSPEREEAPYNGSSFIIERFLPDAQALAEASVMKMESPFSGSPSFSRAVSIGRSHDGLKGCGLGSFLPWKMKHKPCSVKSPVCDTIIGPNVKQKRF